MDIIVKVGDREVTIGTNVERGDDLNLSCYAARFDEGCPHWTNDRKTNLFYLRSQQEYANELLRSRGYLFLNEVFQLLTMPITELGQVCGWIYDPKNPIGDNYVDFGITVVENEEAYILDPNVDGFILDKVKLKKMTKNLF